MKNKITLFIFILTLILKFSCVIHASDEDLRLLENGKKFLYNFRYVASKQTGIIQKIEGTLEYEGKEYYKIYYAKYDQGKSEDENCEWVLACLIRENNGKYFIYTPPELCSHRAIMDSGGFHADKEEVMIFDFNMNRGERYDMQFILEATVPDPSNPEEKIVEYWNCGDYTVEVVSKERKIIDGKERTVLRLWDTRYPSDDDYDVYVIEGIGPIPGSLLGPGLASSDPVGSRNFLRLNGICNPDNEFIFHSSYKGEEDREGEKTKEILAEGLDFEYQRITPPTHSNPTDILNTSPVHYRISGTTKLYGKQYFNVWRYIGNWDMNTAELMCFMRENNGCLYCRQWDIDRDFFTRYRLGEISEYAVPQFIGDGIVCDFNQNPGDEILPNGNGWSTDLILSKETILINGEPRRRIITEYNDFVEGIGIINGGVLPYPTSKMLLSSTGVFQLNCIRDAEGNVIFTRDQLSGIDEVLTGDEGAVEAEYYDLTGRRVINPEKGIYIVKDSSGVHKAVF